MKHFDIGHWTDYVRGIAQPLDREAMASHLHSCQSCAELVAVLTRVAQESAADLAVPEPLVRSAKAVFPAPAPELSGAGWALLPKLTAKLIYSSLNDLVPEGARSATDTLVQVVYHAGNYAIDLQIEPENESVALALVGQVVDRTASGEPLTGIPVGLMARKKMLTTTQSNRFGEFCVMSRLRHGLKLCIQIESAGQRVEIPLDSLIAGFEL